MTTESSPTAWAPNFWAFQGAVFHVLDFVASYWTSCFDLELGFEIQQDPSLVELATKCIARHTGQHQRAWPCSLGYDEASFGHLLQGIGPSVHDGSTLCCMQCLQSLDILLAKEDLHLSKLSENKTFGDSSGDTHTHTRYEKASSYLVYMV